MRDEVEEHQVEAEVGMMAEAVRMEEAIADHVIRKGIQEDHLPGIQIQIQMAEGAQVVKEVLHPPEVVVILQGMEGEPAEGNAVRPQVEEAVHVSPDKKNRAPALFFLKRMKPIPLNLILNIKIQATFL